MTPTALIVLAVTLVAAAVACAEEVPGPTREQYVAEVDPICKTNTDRNTPLLRHGKKLGNEGKYAAAAGKIGKAVTNFAKTLKAIEAVPRPVADSPRLEKWFHFLKIVKAHLAEVRDAVREGNRVKAVHKEIKTERSSNAANNVSYVFGFRDCHLRANP